MPRPQQAYPPEETNRQRKHRYVFYPQARVTLSVVFENFGDPKKPVVIPVLPRSVSVYSNSYKEADSWTIEFDAKDLPVSPDLIRAGSAEIYLFSTPGIGQNPEVVKAKDDPDTPEWEGLEPTIVGLFDEVNTDFSEGGRFVTISGTDYTSLYIAKKWREYEKKEGKKTVKKFKRRVPSGKPLDQVLLQLKQEVESADAMSLVVDPGDLKIPIVGKAEGKPNKKGLPVRDGDTYWDVMYTLATRYGFILFVRGLDLVLTKPQQYITGRTRAKKLAWGKNLLSMKMSRRMGNQQVPIVEIRSYDDSTRTVRKARYPKNAKQVPVTGLGTKRDEVVVHSVHGIKDADQLAEIAQTTYELLGRSEQSIEIETRDLLDLEGEDLVNLRTGDAVTIGIQPNTTEMLEGMSFDQRVQRLKNLGFEPNVALEIARGFDKLDGFRKPFRVREASLEWSYDNGLTIQAKLQNYVNITGETP